MMIGAGVNDRRHEEHSKLANSQKKHCCQGNRNDMTQEIQEMLARMLDLRADFTVWKARVNGSCHTFIKLLVPAFGTY